MFKRKAEVAAILQILQSHLAARGGCTYLSVNCLLHISIFQVPWYEATVCTDTFECRHLTCDDDIHWYNSQSKYLQWLCLLC